MADDRLQKIYDKEGRNTSSTDPKLMNARVFIGNLAADKMTRQEVERLFQDHGKILGVSLHKSYGFVQFAKDEDAATAVKAMHGQIIHGLRLDCNIATERRRDPGRPTAPAIKPRGERREKERERDRDRPRRHRSRSPPAPSRLRPELEYEARLRHLERFGHGSSFPPVRDPYRDPYADPYAMRMRDPYARPRDDPYDRYRERAGPYPHPWDYPRDPYERDMYMYDRMGPPSEREGHEGLPPRGRGSPTRERGSPPVRARGSPPIGAVGGGERPVDMEIIVVNKQQKEYGEYVRSRVQSMGLKVEMAHLSPTVSLADALDDAAQRGLLYAMIITSQHEIHRSTTLTILHGRNPQEHKNMPMDDSLGLVDRDYVRYCQSVREGRIPPRRLAGSSKKDVSALLNKAASGEKLDPQQLEAVISELQKQKQKNSANRMPEEAPSVSSKEDIQRQQADLQAKILSLLGSNAVVPSPSSSQANQGPSSYKGGASNYSAATGQYEGGSYSGGARRDPAGAGGLGGAARGGDYSGGYGYRGYQ